jgi:hypothetical protein
MEVWKAVHQGHFQSPSRVRSTSLRIAVEVADDRLAGREQLIEVRVRPAVRMLAAAA